MQEWCADVNKTLYDQHHFAWSRWSCHNRTMATTYTNVMIAGSPKLHVRQAAAHLERCCKSDLDMGRFESVTPLFRNLHSLRVDYHSGSSKSTAVCITWRRNLYFCDELRRVPDISSRQRLRSSSTSVLIVPPTQLSTVGDRAFPVAVSRTWNNLPLRHSTPPLQRLKPFSFSRSFPS